MRLTPTTVSTIARPGKIVIHGVSRTRSRPSLIMVPQRGNCGAAPPQVALEAGPVTPSERSPAPLAAGLSAWFRP
jgi:hypothetical protein